MEQITYESKLFKDIFPDYQTFKTWYEQTPLSDGDGDSPNARTFALISNEYSDCHVAFTSEGFKEHFANDIYTYYKEFEATTKSINELMALTDDQIQLENQSIMNLANIPETESSTDEETVDFISQQQKHISKKGMLQVKREQIANKRAYTVHSFLNRFKHLFIRIISPAYTFVVKEELED